MALACINAFALMPWGVTTLGYRGTCALMAGLVLVYRGAPSDPVPSAVVTTGASMLTSIATSGIISSRQQSRKAV